MKLKVTKHISQEVKNKVHQDIEKIEEDLKVKVLLAIESSMKSVGIPCSVEQVRYVYVKPPGEYEGVFSDTEPAPLFLLEKVGSGGSLGRDLKLVLDCLEQQKTGVFWMFVQGTNLFESTNRFDGSEAFRAQLLQLIEDHLRLYPKSFGANFWMDIAEMANQSFDFAQQDESKPTSYLMTLYRVVQAHWWQARIEEGFVCAPGQDCLLNQSFDLKSLLHAYWKSQPQDAETKEDQKEILEDIDLMLKNERPSESVKAYIEYELDKMNRNGTKMQILLQEDDQEKFAFSWRKAAHSFLMEQARKFHTTS